MRMAAPPDMPALLDDTELIARSWQHPDSFAVLYDRYFVDIYRYVAGRISLDDAGKELEPLLREACLQILRGLAVSPEVRAAAYQLLAQLPGMRAEGEVMDPLGRPGQALSYEVEASPGTMTEIRLIVDPRSGLPLALETTFPAALADGREVRLRQSTSYEAIGWTDDQPDLPG